MFSMAARQSSMCSSASAEHTQSKDSGPKVAMQVRGVAHLIDPGAWAHVGTPRVMGRARRVLLGEAEPLTLIRADIKHAAGELGLVPLGKREDQAMHLMPFMRMSRTG
jgi:hypothetical protein